MEVDDNNNSNTEKYQIPSKQVDEFTDLLRDLQEIVQNDIEIKKIVKFITKKLSDDDEAFNLYHILCERKKINGYDIRTFSNNFMYPLVKFFDESPSFNHSAHCLQTFKSVFGTMYNKEFAKTFKNLQNIKKLNLKKKEKIKNKKKNKNKFNLNIKNKSKTNEDINEFIGLSSISLIEKCPYIFYKLYVIII